MMNKNKNDSLIQKKLFRETCFVMICQQLSQRAVGFIDGLITSVFLGSMAMAASGLTYPFFSITATFSGMIMLGNQKLFIDFLGKGDKEKAKSVLSTALTTTLVISLSLFLLLFFGAGPIVRLFGAKGNAANLFAGAKEYLIGLSFGVPALTLNAVLTPIAQAEGKTKNITISLVTVAVSDIILDLVLAKTGFGLLGMGIATSVAQWLGLIIIVVPLLKNPIISFSLQDFNYKHLIEITKIGMPNFIQRVCSIFRPILINSMVIAIGGNIAMSAMSMRNNFSNIVECLSNGMASAITLLASLYVGERNKDALKTLRNLSIKSIMSVELLLAIVIVIFADPLAGIYAKDNLQVREYLIIAIRTIAINMPLLALSEAIQSYTQGTGKLKRSNVLRLLSMFVYIVACTFLLGKLFGVIGIWAAFPVSSFLTIITAAFMEYLESKKNGVDLFFPIPDKCDIANNDKIVCQISNGDDAIARIVQASKQMQLFCEQHKIDKKRSMFVALCFEEMACNIIQHNLSEKNLSIDVFVAIIDNNIYIRLRDNCKKFDVVEKYNAFKYNPDQPEKNIGIHVVMKSAKSVEYVNSFGMNNLIITV